MKKAKESMKKFLVLAAATASMTAAHSAVAQESYPQADGHHSAATKRKDAGDAIDIALKAGVTVGGAEFVRRQILKPAGAVDVQLKSLMEEKVAKSAKKASAIESEISVRTEQLIKKHRSDYATYADLDRLPVEIEFMKKDKLRRMASAKNEEQRGAIEKAFDESLKGREKMLAQANQDKIMVDGRLAQTLATDRVLQASRAKLGEAAPKLAKLKSEAAAIENRMANRSAGMTIVETVQSGQVALTALWGAGLLWKYKAEVKEEFSDLGKSIHTGYDKVVGEFSSSPEAKRSTASAQGVK